MRVALPLAELKDSVCGKDTGTEENGEQISERFGVRRIWQNAMVGQQVDMAEFMANGCRQSGWIFETRIFEGDDQPLAVLRMNEQARRPATTALPGMG
jgi:hypothetical protein